MRWKARGGSIVGWSAASLKRTKKRKDSFHLPPLACPSIPECFYLIMNTLCKNYPLCDRGEVS